MAGMLPGVEAARRRRFHRSSGSLDSSGASTEIGSTRRSTLCLYTSNHETHLGSSFQQRSTIKQTHEDEKLDGTAREAKERLDKKLRAHLKSESKRRNGQESSRIVDGIGGSLAVGELKSRVFGVKKSGSRRFSWVKKMGWRKGGRGSSEQEECAICLEQLKDGETLAHLPCTHRFHSLCLVPWLEANAHCPCCRMGVLL